MDTGVNGAMILVSADDPGLHSSQNEQDNKNYAKFAKLAMLEPSNSQEAKDMISSAIEISEKFDTMVFYRLTTRIFLAKALLGEERETIEPLRSGSRFKLARPNIPKDTGCSRKESQDYSPRCSGNCQRNRQS